MLHRLGVQIFIARTRDAAAAWQLRQNGSWDRNGTTEFFTLQRNSYGAYAILMEFSQRQRRNGNGSTATEGWKPGVMQGCKPCLLPVPYFCSLPLSACCCQPVGVSVSRFQTTFRMPGTKWPTLAIVCIMYKTYLFW